MKSLSDVFSFLQPSEKGAVVGIDIGSSSIKVVELEEKKGVLTLNTYGELQLGPYAEKHIGESVTPNPNQEREALVDILRESGVMAKQSVFSMPLSASFVTNATVLAEPTADISALVRVEARKVIPASLSEVTLDWAEIDPAAIDPKETAAVPRNVLIAAIQNGALDRYKSLLQFVGLKEPPTEIECFSAIRALSNTADKDSAIIDIGAISTKLYLSQGGLLKRMHRIRAGGAIATNRIASVLNVDFETAEAKKLSHDRSSVEFSDIKRAHDSSYERALREFAQVLREYEITNNITLGTVYLSGGGTMFPGMEAFVQDILGRQIVRAHPFAKVSYPAFLQDTIKDIGPSFAVALGAALRSYE
jgi:type IV pilus assembly protein PilM